MLTHFIEEALFTELWVRRADEAPEIRLEMAHSRLPDR